MPGRTRGRTVAAVLVAAAMAVAWAALPAAAAVNLVTNPGFESGLTGWSCQNGSTVTSPVHSGSSALEQLSIPVDGVCCVGWFGGRSVGCWGCGRPRPLLGGE